MNRSKRIAPRIISRSYIEKHRRIDDAYSPENTQDPANQPHLVFPIPVPDELEEDLVIKGGVVIRLHSQQAVPPPLPHTIQKRSLELARVMPSAPPLSKMNTSFKNAAVQLPGVADEVESYPCPVCGPDKVFLTVAGLEKHGKEIHPQFLPELRTAIECIQGEWNRRRGTRMSLFRRAGLDKRTKIVLPPSNAVIVMRKNKPHQVVSAERSEEKEAQVNKRTDSKTLVEYGQDENNLICKECSLVFTDPKRLAVHFKMNHSRKKRFVCRWCGKVYEQMTELNLHKSIVHNISNTQSRHLELEGSEAFANPCRVRPGEGPVISSPPSYPNLSESDGSHGDSEENGVCHTQCQLCGLVIVRPSLLLRHMLRVHGHREFAAEISTQGMPPINFFIDGQGTVSWSCCNNTFADRGALLYHRRLLHGLPLKTVQADDPFPSDLHLVNNIVEGDNNSAPLPADLVVGESVVIVSSSNSTGHSPVIQGRVSPPLDNILDSD